jgi:hypothetical protein
MTGELPKGCGFEGQQILGGGGGEPALLTICSCRLGIIWIIGPYFEGW